MKKIAILGSTGSIGVNTLKVIRQMPEHFSVVALTANTNTSLINEQIEEFNPSFVAVGNRDIAKTINPSSIKVYAGDNAIKELIKEIEVDIIVVAISGSAGLIPTIEAVKKGTRVALANKESLVMAGSLIMDLAEENSTEITPLDSEHSAIFQCLEGKDKQTLNKIYLTATGGPFIDMNWNELSNVSPDQALNHPKWKMGKKISIDSATLMNKGLEVIEASVLFGIDIKRIEVLIHPEAIIHSMVEFIDGSLLAQLGMPDMRLPIQYALTYPKRIKSEVETIDFTKIKNLTFRHVDVDKFPCLDIAYRAAHEGGSFPCVLNAVNEECVGAFLNKKIKLPDIPKIVNRVLEKHTKLDHPTIDDILEVDNWARKEASNVFCS